jgi:hypothetical protein
MPLVQDVRDPVNSALADAGMGVPIGTRAGDEPRQSRNV